MSRLKIVFRFIVLGALAFLLTGRDSVQEIIPISSQELLKVKENWERTNKTQADLAVLKYIVDNTIHNEILFREALNLHFHQTDGVVWSRLIRNMRFASQDTSMEDMDDGELFEQALNLDMHVTDLIVKRRLVARMEQFIKNNHYIDQPDNKDIDHFINDNAHLFSDKKSITFSHVFLSPEGKRDKDVEEMGKQLLKELKESKAPPKKAYKMGNLFPHPYRFTHTHYAYIKNLFGKNFADDILMCKTDTWSGPLQSSYGTHLVWLENINTTPAVDLPENRKRAKSILTVEREKQLIVDILIQIQNNYYTVLIDGIPAEDFRLEQLIDTKAVP